MKRSAIAIGLRIPDNAAYTALVTLRRLNVNLGRLERNDVWDLEDFGPPASLIARVEANESIFNPNKHRLVVLESPSPRPGEAWIASPEEPLDEFPPELGKGIDGIARARRYVGWRLFDASGQPASREVVSAAVERLLCNPAIERAILAT
jgi:hypothetical protein